MYEGCDVQKGCIVPEVEEREESCLVERICPIVVAFGGEEHPKEPKTKDQIVVEIYGYADKWVAFGISQDNEMGDDFVVECCAEGQKINLYNSWNYNYTNIRQRGDQGPDGIIKLKHTVREGSALYCKFYIQAIFERTPTNQAQTYKYNLFTTEYHLVMATGDDLIEEGKVTKKGNLLVHRDTRYSSGGSYHLGKRFEPNGRQIKILEVHGILLVICWFYFLPMGIFVGRYMKETSRNYVMCGTKVWRFVHVMCMSTAGMLMLAALGCHVAGRLGWYEAGKNKFHIYSGWFVNLSAIFLVITGYQLTKENLTEGFDFNEYFHGLLAHVSYLYGLLIIYFSPTGSRYSRLPCAVSPLTVGWVVIYLIMQIPITLHYCWLDYLYCNGYGGVSNSIFVFNTLTLRSNTTSDPPGSLTRINMTLIFIGVTFLYGTIVLCVVFFGNPCYQ